MHLTNHLLTQDLRGISQGSTFYIPRGYRREGKKILTPADRGRRQFGSYLARNLTPEMEKKGKKRTKDIEESRAGRISLRLASLAISRFSQFFEQWISRTKRLGALDIRNFLSFGHFYGIEKVDTS
ncbi:hypothetical protein TNCT_196551 [Trichonephila clavata]|uniref:Uncharacterized protein n=1 Tax=Trichonephila clavata TaxID=2740835 RepID=A0A8X6EYK9_TRICU|nr:hypothetical protein TNCT_196551 [Trichonephila clavata]